MEADYGGDGEEEEEEDEEEDVVHESGAAGSSANGAQQATSSHESDADEVEVSVASSSATHKQAKHTSQAPSSSKSRRGQLLECQSCDEDECEYPCKECAYHSCFILEDRGGKVDIAYAQANADGTHPTFFDISTRFIRDPNRSRKRARAS